MNFNCCCVLFNNLFVVCSFDCGLLVVKYMKLWDGSGQFDGNNFPDYITIIITFINLQL